MDRGQRVANERHGSAGMIRVEYPRIDKAQTRGGIDEWLKKLLHKARHHLLRHRLPLRPRRHRRPWPRLREPLLWKMPGPRK